ncbi:hypothetical protein KCV07_g9543, partial [Aureobasidium melanogenum]
MYVIEENIIIRAELQPIRFESQIYQNHSVHEAIAGQHRSHFQNVGRLIRPNKIGAWTEVGEAAGGIRGGIAGGVAGGCGLLLIRLVAACLAGLVVIPSAVTGVWAGVLSGGTGAGAAAGMRITEDAKWKGTSRESEDKHQKIK